MDMMEPVLYRVCPGIDLRAVRTEKFKTGTLSVSMVLPIDAERTPLTSLLLAVLRRGTERYPTLAALNRRLDYLFGTELSIRNFYRGDNQIVGFSAEMINDTYLPQREDLPRQILEVMCELLFHPLTDGDGLLLSRYVESERQMQCDSIRAAVNNPRAYAFDCFRPIFYRDEPFGLPVLGSVEAVREITAEALTRRWRELLDPIRLDCFYVGPDDPAEIAATIADTLGRELAGREIGGATPRFSTRPATSPVRRAEGELAVSQGHLLMGLRADRLMNDPAYAALCVWNEMLGVSPISKLFLNVRERRSLCYSCSSNLHGYKGTVEIYCGLDPARREEAEEEILRQIRAIEAGDFDENELQVAKKSLENACRQLEDSPTALESYYYGRSLLGIDASPEASRRAFAAITREDVLAVAHEIRLDTVYFLKGTLASGEEAEDEED